MAQNDVSVPERALQLARAGACRTVQDVKRQLAQEGFTSVDAHLAGMSIRKQLRALLADRATGKPPA